MGGAIKCPGRQCATRLRPGFEDHTVCSDPFRKSSILLHSSRTSQMSVVTQSGPI